MSHFPITCVGNKKAHMTKRSGKCMMNPIFIIVVLLIASFFDILPGTVLFSIKGHLEMYRNILYFIFILYLLMMVVTVIEKLY